MPRKNYSIAVPEDLEYDFEELKEKIKRTTDLARIHNKKSPHLKKMPESVAELFILSMGGVCDVFIKKLEGKITDEELEKLGNHRQYLKEYYRDYRAKEKKSKK